MFKLSILPLPLEDALALAWFFACWAGYAYYADHSRWGTRELTSVLHDYRLRWMRRMMERDNRIADAAIIAALLRSNNLFITTTLFILAGLVTILGTIDRAREVAAGLFFIAPAPREVWELKVLLLIGIFIYAFFKFVWSLRQFNFSLILVGASPMPGETKAADYADFAPRAAMLVTRAFSSFNRGQRAYAFGLAALTWFIQPWALALAAIWVVLVLYRRECRSVTLATLADPVTEKGERIKS
ncbi:MAG: DUF599 family protein [Alphaproteobacteria bacterium]|nr:DUF599 family protein [Alphaproteobacteria bacterium]